ncbi:hypothetical protein FA15DRAFT_703610 [Coprinopsis marcescibilis]|uniref:Uncharacterized protein n=1 Tax=Coprinopsis marcescibilis TaxID=230819 RepID=A0A5C3KYY2_COPMA|nr:hypothetical protein FA15DRAFT_703610 [Coprinopsis marcescibilis]
MAFPQYQQPGQPGWAAGQYPSQYGGLPPAPSFQPQSTWGGLDFYRAHAPTNHDPSLFNVAWDRVRQFDPVNAQAGGLGVGLHEARHWHRRAYGGVNELTLMAPAEVGHAAAYEAYRTWSQNQSMYEPFGGDIERQREGLIGLAVAESSRLLSFAGRLGDAYARSMASDAAAHTASHIFYQRRRDDEYYRHRGRSRSRGRYDDRDWDREGDYRYDDDRDDMRYDQYDHRGRSRSRHRSRSRPRSYSAHPYDVHGTPYPQPGMPLGAPGAYPGVPSYAGSASGMIPPPPPLSAGGYSNGYPPSGYYPGQAGSAYGQGYAPGMSVPGYPPNQHMAIPLGHAGSTGSAYSYGSQPYMGTAGSIGSAGVPVGGTTMPQAIVIHKSRRHKHHHHRSRSRAGSE